MSPAALRRRTKKEEIKARVWIDGNHCYYYFDLVEWMEKRPLWEKGRNMQPAALRRVPR